MSEEKEPGTATAFAEMPERGPDTASGTGTDTGAQQAAAGMQSGGADMLPAPTFTTFIMSLASSALVQLGEVPEPETGKVQENLVVAKHTIDIVSMLQEKINKGLDADEQRLLEGLLYELRLQYIMKNK